jgi:hypothetical protein
VIGKVGTNVEILIAIPDILKMYIYLFKHLELTTVSL